MLRSHYEPEALFRDGVEGVGVAIHGDDGTERVILITNCSSWIEF